MQSPLTLHFYNNKSKGIKIRLILMGYEMLIVFSLCIFLPKCQDYLSS